MTPEAAGERVDAVARTHAALEAIRRRDAVVRAWACVDEAAALAQAERLDGAPTRGPLHGLPVGVKDIIDTHDLPTAYGSPIYAQHRPRRDATVVALLRRAGAVVIGKTTTTEFALFTPAPTTNPLDPGHTPGGSSSGSAAAVAAGMVAFAVGTQTGGSLIRPAAYCGVVGYKPSFGLVSRAGVFALAESLDTVGAIATSVADAALLASVLADRRELATVGVAPAPPRLVRCRTEHRFPAEDAAMAGLDAVADAARSGGAHVVDRDLPATLAALAADQSTVLKFELRANLAFERDHHWDALSSGLQALLDAADACDAADHAHALARADAGKRVLDRLLADADVLLTPSAPGPAPAGLETTGDPVFNSAWTLLGCPCITLPVPRAGDVLPVGVQLVARPGQDVTLLAVAAWLERRLAGPETSWEETRWSGSSHW